MAKPPKIIVLGGGGSTERDVSLRSAASVVRALEEAGFNVVNLDPAQDLKGLDGLDPSKNIVFPILHGAGGEDGSIQAELERRQLPYLGADSKVSEICFSKTKTRDVLTKAGLPVAEGAKVTAANYLDNHLSKKAHVLKVEKGGSSIGTYIVRNPIHIDDDEVKKVFSLDKNAVIEELIEGVEITVPILDKKALPVIEIRPPENQDFDYENKYNGKTLELCPPENIKKETQTKAQTLAEKVHQTLNCRHLSRIDIIVRPNGDMVVLELNTIPGMTDQSLYPKSAAVAGLDMPVLMKKFVDLVKRDYKIN